MNVLFNLCPCTEDSVFVEAIRVCEQVRDYVHFTSSTSFDICCISLLVLSAPRQMRVYCVIGDWSRAAYRP